MMRDSELTAYDGAAYRILRTLLDMFEGVGDFHTVLIAFARAWHTVTGWHMAAVYQHDGEVWRLKSTFGFAGALPEQVGEPLIPEPGHTVDAAWTRYLPLPSGTAPLLYQLQSTGTLFCFGVPADEFAEYRALRDAVFALLIPNMEHRYLTWRLSEQMVQSKREAEMLQRLDREIAEHIQLDHVLALTLDWATRYTMAPAGAVLLYDAAGTHLRVAAQVGYAQTLSSALVEQAERILMQALEHGDPLIIGDMEAEALSIGSHAPDMRAHLSIPLLRYERVLGVMMLESGRAHAFTREHVAFLERLSSRATVAIEHAKLYTQTRIEREKLNLIVDSIADVVIVIDHDSRIVLLNASAIAAFQLSRELYFAGELFETFFEETPLFRAFEDARRSRSGSVSEVTLEDGRTYHMRFSYQPDIGWIIVLHDISPLKAADEAKNELFGTVSHDLKTPLQNTRGYIELVQMLNPSVNTPPSDRYIQLAFRSIENMRALIDDFIEFARTERGLVLNIAPVDLHALLTECAELLTPLAVGRSIRVELHLLHLAPIDGDFKRLTQIFTNLIGNAIKYTPPEGTVTVGMVERENGVSVSVCDTGIGISPEDQAHIFERFYRVRRPETAAIDGTGLGLSIVHRLVTAHSAHIAVESTLGEGSTFTVHLPRTQPG
jgi:signal transduction histidine kinase